MATKALPKRRSRTLILGGVAAALVWLVISRSLAAYLADAAPQAALWLQPGQPRALVNLVDRSLNSTDTGLRSPSGGADADTQAGKAGDSTTDDSHSPPGPAGNVATAGPGADEAHDLAAAFATVDQSRSIDLVALHGQAVAALTREPLNPRALRLIGQIDSAGNDEADAAKFMAAAVRFSLHENVAALWLMRKSANAGDYKAAIAYADTVLRTTPALAYYAVPVLAHFAADKTSIGAVEEVLNNNPPWRPIFFRLLPQSVTDPRTPLKLLLALKGSPAPPTDADVGRYLDVLVAHQFYDLAYYTWLQFLPLDQLRSAGLLFNGSFETALSDTPFDWTIKQGAGVTIDIVPRSDIRDQHALSVDFLYGRVDYHSVHQVVVLQPGAYQFAGQYSGKIVGPRGMKWRIICLNDLRTRIGESPMITGVASSWKRTDFTFTVPATDCRAQTVELDLDARMASEQLVTGTMLFDDLSISRVAAAAKPPAPTTPPIAQPVAPQAAASSKQPVKP